MASRLVGSVLFHVEPLKPGASTLVLVGPRKGLARTGIPGSASETAQRNRQGKSPLRRHSARDRPTQIRRATRWQISLMLCASGSAACCVSAVN